MLNWGLAEQSINETDSHASRTAICILVIVFMFLKPRPSAPWSWGRLGCTWGAVPDGGGCTAGMMAVRKVFSVSGCHLSQEKYYSVSLSFRLFA